MIFQKKIVRKKDIIIINGQENELNASYKLRVRSDCYFFLCVFGPQEGATFTKRVLTVRLQEMRQPGPPFKSQSAFHQFPLKAKS